MVSTTNVVIGQLLLKTLPELQCFTNFTDFLKALPDLYAVAVPSSVTNVIVGPSQPTSSQTSSVWVRINNAGTFLGIYVFSDGKWIQICPAPNQIIWMYGDSSAIPDGYTSTDDAAGGKISTTLATALKTLWIPGALAGPPYEYFSVILT